MTLNNVAKQLDNVSEMKQSANSFKQSTQQFDNAHIFNWFRQRTIALDNEQYPETMCSFY